MAQNKAKPQFKLGKYHDPLDHEDCQTIDVIQLFCHYLFDLLFVPVLINNHLMYRNITYIFSITNRFSMENMLQLLWVPLLKSDSFLAQKLCPNSQT